ncbi:MAG: hypothetical protein M1837_003527 [Sclerophora amabilis]|nr:MAG: hypothetical protein M1837_003527 [Sclerophora amabilis]
MASIFTYDPDPPRVMSPWLSSGATSAQLEKSIEGAPACLQAANMADEQSERQIAAAIDPSVTRLRPEPQEGPTEYKLHLLLRPRRTFNTSSTGHYIHGSHQSKSSSPSTYPLEHGPSSAPSSLSRRPAQSAQSRQNRLQQLTTQLLWRLQQSSQYHASAQSEVTPSNVHYVSFPVGEGNDPDHAVPGLEESHGALYEIGVSDDGTFVGLIKDEMDESLTTLRAMAASLGCVVKVLRMVPVGDCQWLEPPASDREVASSLQSDRLWVAEALVLPILETGRSQTPGRTSATSYHSREHQSHQAQLGGSNANGINSTTRQLRVSLAGATTSGKSSLLGTLSTNTLDNGRGKSRLSLLKHRHELASGVTSSVAPELIGYTSDAQDDNSVSRVVNYASEGVGSWSDMHASTRAGRLVFFSDSAGHPRYRRTAVRGLVGWAPHWTVLCVAADSTEGGAAYDQSQSSPAVQRLSSSLESEHSLSLAHLHICLRLKLPLVVVITKLDLAKREILRGTLSSILSTLKEAGRQPMIVPSSSVQPGPSEGTDLQNIPRREEEGVNHALTTLESSGLESVVPIVLTSSVTGMGIMSLHALLQKLPIPDPAHPIATSSLRTNSAVTTLFHVEEIYNLPVSTTFSAEAGSRSQFEAGSVISGHVRYGEVYIGAEMSVGPFPTDHVDERIPPNNPREGSPSLYHEKNSTYLSICTPPRSSTSLPTRPSTTGATPVRNEVPEWCRVRVVSIRNLRLPVRKLLAGQVGTIGIIRVSSANEGSLVGKPDSTTHVIHPPSYLTIPGLRKGMVMGNFAGSQMPRSQKGFVGQFLADQATSISCGSLAVVYVASVRASARVVKVRLESPERIGQTQDSRDDDLPFDLDDSEVTNKVRVSFEYTTGREWVEVGCQVLIMPGGGPGLFSVPSKKGKGTGGLEAFVGKIVEVSE